MNKRRGWKVLAVISWLVFVALIASPLAVEYGLIRPVPDGEAKGALTVLGILAFIVGVASTIASFPSNEEEMRVKEMREYTHMRLCRVGRRCHHPNHVHLESGVYD